MKGYVTQKLNTDRRFSVKTTPLAAANNVDENKPDNQERTDIKT